MIIIQQTKFRLNGKEITLEELEKHLKRRKESRRKLFLVLLLVSIIGIVGLYQ